MAFGLRRFSHSTSADVDAVLDTAALLGVREFELFRHADHWWHGQARPERSLERVFVRYMFTGVAPPWVRQFCRCILSEWAAGRLDPRQFGVPRRRPVAPKVRAGPLYLASAVVVALAFYAMLLIHVSAPAHSDSRLSCQGGGPGLAAIETMAHWLGRGQPPPPCPGQATEHPTGGQR